MAKKDKKPIRTKTGNWLKNFGASVKYAAQDVLTEVIPNTASVATDIKSDVSEVRSTLRNLRQNKKQILSYLLGDEDHITEYVGKGIDNAIDSLKTGKIIDKKREERMSNEAFGGGDFDDFGNFDTDFNFDDSTDTNFGGVSMGAEKIVSMMGSNVEATTHVGQSVSTMDENMVHGFQALDKSNKQALGISLAITQKLGQSQLDALSNVNDNLSAVVKFNNESISPFVQASLKYYDETTVLMKSINDTLLRMAPPEKKKAGPTSTEDLSTELLSGNFSLANYGKVVAQNARSAFQNSPLGMLSMINDPMILSSIMANPLGFALSGGMKSMIPKSLLNRLTKVDTTFKEFIPSLLSRISDMDNYNNNGFLQMFGQIFGVKSRRTTISHNAGKFERGQIPFDGETKKAIVEVIPSYLSKINQNLEAYMREFEDYFELTEAMRATARDSATQMVYDWDPNSATAGQVMDRRVLEKNRAETQRQRKLSGAYDFRFDTMSNFREINGYNGSVDSEEVSKRLDKLIEYFIDNSRTFNPNKIQDVIQEIFKDMGEEVPLMVQKAIQMNSEATNMTMRGSAIAQGRRAMREMDEQARNNTSVTNMENFTHRGNVFNLGGSIRPEYYKGRSVYGIKKRLDDDTKYEAVSEKSISNAMIVMNRAAEHAGVEKVFSTTGMTAKNAKYYATNVDEFIKKIQEHEANLAKANNQQSNSANAKIANLDRSDPEYSKKAQEILDDEYGKNGEKAKASRMEKLKSEDNSVSGAIARMFKAPLDFVNSSLDKLDNAMYEVIFGEDSLFTNAIDGVKNTFNNIGGWIQDNIFQPIKSRFFGDIQDSEVAKSAKEAITSSVMGTQGEDGRWSGGLLSEVVNGTKDFFGNVKTQWNEWAKPKLEEFGGIIKEYMFGKDEDADKNKPKKPLMDKVMDTISLGFNQWSDIFFGGTGEDAKSGEKAGKNAREQFKKAMPKIGNGLIAGAALGTVSGLGGFGVLGSLFLPGGPIGGALVGSAIGLLSSSDRFKNWMFGEEVDNGDGTKSRADGIISANVQNFFKKNKTALIGGAALGAAKVAMFGGGVGLIPSMAIGLTGPVLGGAAWGLLMKSQTMQEALFGKDDPNSKDGKKIGGLMNKQFIQRLKKSAPKAVVGALGSMAGFTVLGQMGLLGSMVALGPMNAAILGGALGFMSSSDDFRKHFFGYTDDKGNHVDGALDKVSNFLTLRAFKPFSLFLEEKIAKSGNWFERNIALPIGDALFPLKLQMRKFGKSMMDHLNNIFGGIGRSFKDIFDVMGSRMKTMFNLIMTPIKRMTKTALSIAGMMTRTAMKLSIMPLTLAGGIASRSIKNDAKKSYRGQMKANFSNALNTGGIGDVFKAGGSLFNAYLNPEEAYEHDEYAKELVEHEKESARKRKELDRQRKEMGDYYSGKWDELDQMQKGIKALPKDERKKAQAALDSAKKRQSSLDALAINAEKSPEAAAAFEQINEQKKTNELLTNIRDDQKGQIEAEAAKDDNAVKAAAAKREEDAKEEQAENLKKIAENTEMTTQALSGLKTDTKSDREGFFSKLIKNGGSILSGVMGIGSSVLGVIGKIGAVATLLTLLFGDKKDGGAASKIIDSNAFGNVATRGMRGLVRGGLSFGSKLMGSVGKSLRNMMFGKSFLTDEAAKSVRSIKDKMDKKVFTKETGEEMIEFIKNRKGNTESLFDIGKRGITSAKDKLAKSAPVSAIDKILFGGPELKSYQKWLLNNYEKGARSKDPKLAEEYKKAIEKIKADENSYKQTRGIVGGTKDKINSLIKYIRNDTSLGSTLFGGNVLTKSAKETIDKTMAEINSGNLSEHEIAKRRAGIKRLKTDPNSRRVKTSIFSDLKEGAKDAYGSLFKSADKQLATNAAKTVVEDVAENKSLLSKVVESITTTIKEKGKFLGSKGAAIANALVGLAQKIFGDKKILKMVMAKAAKVTTRLGLAAGTAGLATLAFGAYDGITGMADAAQYFDVASEDCDIKMRMIAGLVNVLFGLPAMGYIDIALSLASTGLIALGSSAFGQMLSKFGLSINGFDHRKIVCQWIYREMSSDEDIADLDAKQNKLLGEYKKYADAHKDENISFEEWNAKYGNGQSMWQKYGAPIFRRVFGVEPKDGKNVSFMDRVKDGMTGLVDWFQKAVQSVTKWSPFSFIKGLFGFGDPDADGGEGLGNQANSYVKGIWENLKEKFKPSASKPDLNVEVTDNDDYVADGEGGLGKYKNSIASVGKKMNDSITKAKKAFSGGGDDEKTPDVPAKNVTLANGKDSLKYYWNQTEAPLADLQVAPNADPNFGTFKDFGCAPTTMAMVASIYNGQAISPAETAKEVEKEDLNYNGIKGIKGSYFEHAADTYNLQMNDKNGRGASIIDSLQAGNMVILGGRKGMFENQEETPFTTSGHYVVVGGISEDAKRGYVYDPLGRSGVYDIDRLYSDALSTYGSGFAASFEPAFGKPKKKKLKEKDKGNDKGVQAKAIIMRARDYCKVHTPYDLNSFGGAPGVGTSCCKFVTDVFKDCGIDLCNNSAYVPDLYEFLKKIDALEGPDSKPEPGDIVIWDRDTVSANGQGGECAHVGILTGESKNFIHAGFSTGVKECSDYENYLGSDFHVKCIAKFKYIPGTAKYHGGSGKGGSFDTKNGKGSASSNKTGIARFLELMAEGVTGVISSTLSGEKWKGFDSAASGSASKDLRVGGSGVPIDVDITGNNQKDVWNFLKGRGYSDNAIAGILGNWQQESGVNPKTMEYHYAKGFDSSVYESNDINAIMDAHTERIFSDTPYSLDHDAYKGSDGHYYPGLGLGQWTGPRGQRLIEMARNSGKIWTDLGTQLNLFNNEMDNNIRGNVKDQINAATSPEDAASKFGYGFEGNIGNSESNRKEYARKFFTEFAGSGDRTPDQINSDIQALRDRQIAARKEMFAKVSPLKPNQIATIRSLNKYWKRSATDEQRKSNIQKYLDGYKSGLTADQFITFDDEFTAYSESANKEYQSLLTELNTASANTPTANTTKPIVPTTTPAKPATPADKAVVPPEAPKPASVPVSTPVKPNIPEVDPFAPTDEEIDQFIAKNPGYNRARAAIMIRRNKKVLAQKKAVGPDGGVVKPDGKGGFIKVDEPKIVPEKSPVPSPNPTSDNKDPGEVLIEAANALNDAAKKQGDAAGELKDGAKDIGNAANTIPTIPSAKGTATKKDYKAAKEALFKKYNVKIDDYEEIKRQLNRQADQYKDSDPERYKKVKSDILSAYGIKVEDWDKMNEEHYSLRKGEEFGHLKMGATKKKNIFSKVGELKLFGRSKAYKAAHPKEAKPSVAKAAANKVPTINKNNNAAANKEELARIQAIDIEQLIKDKKFVDLAPDVLEFNKIKPDDSIDVMRAKLEAQKKELIARYSGGSNTSTLEAKKGRPEGKKSVGQKIKDKFKTWFGGKKKTATNSADTKDGTKPSSDGKTKPADTKPKATKKDYKAAKEALFKKYNISIDDYEEIKRQLNRIHDSYGTSDPEKYKADKAKILAAYNIKPEDWDKLNEEHYALRKGSEFGHLNMGATKKKNIFSKLGELKPFGHSKAYEALHPKADTTSTGNSTPKDSQEALKPSGETPTGSKIDDKQTPVTIGKVPEKPKVELVNKKPETPANVANTSISPSAAKIAGMDMAELIQSVRALDTHKELAEIIGYLKAIAGNGIGGSGNGEGKVKMKGKDVTKAAKEFAKTKSNTTVVPGSKVADLIDAKSGIALSPHEVAAKIAAGGDFKRT